MTKRVWSALCACAIVAGMLVGCKEDPPPSLYDATAASGPQPKIAAIAPAGGGLAGVTSLTITGENFNTVPANNLVFFDDVVAPVLQATATQLQLKAPILIKDSIKVKIAVLRSDLYSTPYLYNLTAATDEKFGGISASDEVVSIEADTAGNIFASMLVSGVGSGVWKFSPEGVQGAAAYSPAFSSGVASWRGMKFGAGGAIFCVAGRAIIFRIPPGGGASAVWTSGSGLTNLNDLDFDQNGNMWAGGGPATSIFRIKQDKTVQAFPFVGTVRSVRVYNGYLYVGGKRDSLEKVWRFQISGDNLGTEEEYFNVSSVYGANSSGVYGLSFDTDGDMYVGTDAAAGILLVHPNKASEPYYPGLLKPSTTYLTWGKGAFLFQARGGTVNTKTMVKINTLKTSAPYFGRTL